MDENHLYEIFQFACKNFHPTEADMVHAKNDPLSVLDDENVILVVCLDLSAAFDTFDHEIILTRLEKQIDIPGNCLAWFHSYLTNRSQKVQINGATTLGKTTFECKLFNVYTLPFEDIMHKHQIDFHIYADDDNLYLPFKPLGISSPYISMESLISDIQD